MSQRFLIIERACPFCRKWMGVIEEVNASLSPEDRIQIIDITDYNEYDLNLYPILDDLEYIGTPTLYIDKIKKRLDGLTSKTYGKEFVKKILEND